MSGWWVQDLYHAGKIVEIVSRVFWVIGAIVLHELAHGWAALWQGDDTPRRLGRMTANPLVHMGPWSLLFLAIVGIAWGVMPTDPNKYRWRRRGRVVVSGAGPVMNLLLAAVALTALVVWLKVGPAGQPIYGNLAIFLWTGGWLNLLLAGFNMLPIPPLDGASVLSGLSLRFYILFQNPKAQMVGMFIVLVVFMSGIGWFVFAAVYIMAQIFVDGLGALLGNPPVFDVIYS